MYSLREEEEEDLEEEVLRTSPEPLEQVLLTSP